jgi:hypothetical protein
MATTGGSTGAGELTYDKRLFNHDTGMDSGFADDQYNVYSGRLFVVQPLALSMLYRLKALCLVLVISDNA